MRTKKLLFIVFISFFMTSCASTFYYQVYKAEPSDKLVMKDNNLVYEDVNCKVSYNLWNEGGNIGFLFFNKTEKGIYLNLDECFFILNGISHNYYRNRVFTNSTSSGSSASRGAAISKYVSGINFSELLQANRVSATNTIGIMSTSEFSVSYTEDKIICIPSMTSKIVSEYTINESLYRDCALFLYPNKKQVGTKTFTKTNSPLVFSNRIAYRLGQTDPLMRFENEFYVKEISNYSANEVLDSGFEEFCGQKNTISTKYFKNVSPDKFYVKYIKDAWVH